MGWRYRRPVRLAPGSRINITGSGVSTVSFGSRGATLNMGKGGTRTTFGLPGSGVSYSSRTSSGSTLGAGLGIVGLLVLMISAARGNKLAQATLVILGVGLGYLVLSSGSHPNAAVTVRSEPVASYISASVPVNATPISVPKPVVTSAPIVAASADAGPVASPIDAVVMTTTGANVRSAPSMSAPVLHQLPKGARLAVVKTDGDWDQVRDDSQTSIGWVHKSILRPAN
jgi:Protein of unknown function (DUF4236)/Bacterial SH3 domain